jgi:hypothetical protein
MKEPARDHFGLVVVVTVFLGTLLTLSCVAALVIWALS